jgi:hypothetical protein
VIGIAVMIAVAELRAGFSQIAGPERLAAHHARISPARRSAVYKYKSHVAAPKEKHSTGNTELDNKKGRELLKAQPPCSGLVKLQMALWHLG